MSTITGSRTLEALDLQECWALLARDTVGRIAYTNGDRTFVLPVNYVVSGSDVLVRTDPESALGRAVAGRVVAFEVDKIDRATHTGWSVLVQGLASATDLSAEPPRPSLAGLEPWAEGERQLLVRIEVDAISGRRLVSPEPGARRRWGRA